MSVETDLSRSSRHVNCAAAPATPRAAWAALWTGRMRLQGVRDTCDPGRRCLLLAPSSGPALSQRQRAVVRAIACGFCEVDVARVLSLAPSTVATYAAHGAAKLGLSTTGLCYLLPASVLPAGLTVELAVEGPLPCPCPQGARWDGYALSFPMPPAAVPATLTPSERRVLLHLLDGLSYEQIGRLRGTSVRTVANQASGVYEKLNVAGRRQLDPGMRPALAGGAP